jgi:hypothetical protein
VTGISQQNIMTAVLIAQIFKHFNYNKILKYFGCKILFNMGIHSAIGFVIIIYGLSYTEITLLYESDSGRQVSGFVI